MAQPSQHEIITQDIERLYAADTRDKTFSARPPRRRLSDILGADSTPRGHWWRLYINPMHHRDAIYQYNEAVKSNHTLSDIDFPGGFYDRDRSPGFQAAMLASYKSLLDSENLPDLAKLYDEELPTSKPRFRLACLSSNQPTDKGYLYSITWEKYLQIHKDAIPEANKSGSDAWTARIGAGAKTVMCKTAPTLPPDMLSETILKAKLTHETEGKALTFYKYVFGANRINSPPASAEEWVARLNFVGDRYAKEFSVAKTRLAQLEAIARFIRALHVLHAFEDGNGRTNVFSILPALLLWNGFGLPIGGRCKDEIISGSRGLVKSRLVGVIDELFNGGFSVNVMAKFLWIMQDLGEAGPPNETIISDQIVEHPAVPR